MSQLIMSRASAIASLMIAATLTNAYAFEERRVKLAHPMAKDNPIGLAAEKFAEIAKAKSGGKMKITAYPGAQLGNEIQSISSAQGGIIEMAVVSTAGAANNVKELAIFDLPFMYQNEKEADAVVDGEVGQALLKKFPEKNLVGLCYWDYGFRQVSNSKHPINKLEDFNGLKIRVLQNRVYIDTFKALGANPLPLPYPETYSALETKAVDGQESAYLVTKSSSYQDVQKFMTETRHVYLPAVVLVSKKFWDRLKDDEKQLMQSACDESKTYHREVSRKLEKTVMQDLSKAGMQLNTINDAERARLVKAVAPVIEKYKGEVGADLVNKATAIIDKVRKGG